MLYLCVKNTFLYVITLLIVVFRLANFEDEKSTKINEKKNDQSSLAAYVYSLLDKRLTWEDIKWLKRFEIQYIINISYECKYSRLKNGSY